jgi:hypothetical protein
MSTGIPNQLTALVVLTQYARELERLIERLKAQYKVSDNG